VVEFLFKTKLSPVSTSYKLRINEWQLEKFSDPDTTGNCVQRKSTDDVLLGKITM
jgi:hypothetical protein